jgi:protein-tyrosine-phosphatase
MTSNNTLSVLFVRTGNVCRSPTAESVLLDLVEAASRGLLDHVQGHLFCVST